MNYTSTRNNNLSCNASHAIASGLSQEGGLFVPKEFPKVGEEWLSALAEMDYPGRARTVLSLFLDDYSGEELRTAVEGAYTGGVFEDDEPAPLSDLSDGRFALELWHGPTCAFKDMALQLTPRLLVPAAKRALGGKRILILVATSGDTGKAALEGFRDIDGIKIAVFYPETGVSPMQKRQMATQEGNNVAVYALRGNFDNAQAEVKRIFTDEAVKARLLEAGTVLSSANSINWGRLVPQIVYYFSAWADLLKDGRIQKGEKINFVVPTGNFGNILAGWFAKEMGLPVGKFICASNRNNILTDFIRTGVYDANRSFYTTLSPSMDILISSNLERLLFCLSGGNSDEIAAMMQKLGTEGKYEIPAAMKEALSRDFFGASLDDEETKAEIRRTFDSLGYLIDPHTAVAFGAYDRYRAETGDGAKTVIVSTASPYKFSASVLSALGAEVPADEFLTVERLSKKTGTVPPESLLRLKNAAVRFDRTLSREEMAGAVLDFAKGLA
ncbi:MAG TPA: threonine synthase [Candidatus Fimivivens faecavium]|nr:threonine synthase [Candidatus Fimivivens faecavium]